MTPNLQQVQFVEVYLHTVPGAVHRETHHDCVKWVPLGSDSERLGRSLAAEACAKIIQRSVITTSASEQHREHLRETSCVARKRASGRDELKVGYVGGLQRQLQCSGLRHLHQHVL